MTDQLDSAFENWLDIQARALAAMRAALPADAPDEDRAEGHRWLTRMSRLVLDWAVERGDPLRPVLFRAQDEHTKLMGDNPDVTYHFCVLDPARAYRLHGKRGGASYLGLTFGSDLFGGNDRLGGTTAQHDFDSFETSPDGTVEIRLGGARESTNWIELPPDTAHLAIRETFHDRATQPPAELAIEPIEMPQPPRLDTAELAASLERAGNFLLTIVDMCIATYAAGGLLVNAIAGASGAAHGQQGHGSVRGHSDADMFYMGGRWRLEPGTMLQTHIVGVERHAEVLAPSPYDPQGKQMRL